MTLALLIFSTNVFSQSKFYIGVEANFIQDQYLIKDEGTAVSTPNMHAIDIPGTTFLLGYQFNPVFSLETGIATRPVKIGYGLNFDDVRTMSESSNAYYHIPLRTRAVVPLIGNWLSGTASVGVQLSVTDPTRIGTTSTGGYGEGGGTRNGEPLYSRRSSYTSYNSIFFTVSSDLGLQFNLSKKFSLYTTISYNRGFKDLEKVDIEYQYMNEPVKKANIRHQGTYISPNFGLKYRF
ncbi:outer membrane beta-barrel protein [Marivirga arenosa]|uniref:Outer membrane beta-barrel protein n=1 Tax=Marivirga arenosa TaxID=3059076 RepID=A0AA49JAT8_9BACT|nr:outer membrane beta-barrel protein [Marivirga sp. ABR2-2]WKK84423.2 outer membrane beta-barrel protein [Marivirga sp. ABR2-2]